MAAGCNGNPVNYQEMEIREKIYKSLKGNGLPEWLKVRITIFILDYSRRA